MKLLSTILLLLAISCNPVSRLQRVQSQINDLTDMVNNSRNVVQVKDSIITLPGRVDSVTFSSKDTLNNTNTVTKYFYTNDTTIIIKPDVSLLNSARRTADLASGKFEGLNLSISGLDKQIKILFIVCICESILIGILLFFIFKFI